MAWHYVHNGKSVGPINDQDFQQLVQQGVITGETMVWREGMATWQAYRELSASAGTVASGAPAGGVVCRECGNTFPMDQVVNVAGSYVCAACKPIFMQKLQEGAVVAGSDGMQYAGFWIRVGAKLIDGIILGIASLVFLVPLMIFGMSQSGGNSSEAAALPMMGLQIGFQLVWMVVSALYAIFFIGKYGATPGKMACKLKVVMADGGKVSYGRACGRFFAEILSQIICYIGYLMVAFDKEQHQALHDRICNTRVIRAP
jgi:uncharacterized RDD family membrane protein YckC